MTIAVIAELLVSEVDFARPGAESQRPSSIQFPTVYYNQQVSTPTPIQLGTKMKACLSIMISNRYNPALLSEETSIISTYCAIFTARCGHFRSGTSEIATLFPRLHSYAVGIPSSGVKSRMSHMKKSRSRGKTTTDASDFSTVSFKKREIIRKHLSTTKTHTVIFSKFL